MGGAKRYPSTTVRVAMGIASLHPSYENMLSRSRGADRPRFAGELPASRNRGRREDRVRAAPAVSHANAHGKRRHTSIQGSGSIPAFPAQWLYGLYVVSPVNGSFATVAAREISPAQLDASTAASEPHDFAVRSRRVRLSRLSCPSH